MINVVTSHNQIFNADQLAVDIIKEYQTDNRAIIELNSEGPCCRAVGLYTILDNICQTFKFDKSKIVIRTSNAEEFSNEYTIQIKDQHWIPMALNSAQQWGYSRENFYKQKNFSNLFACLYNIPSWNRLSLLAYIKQNTKHKSLLACNGTWEAHKHNTYYLNQVVDYAPEEFFNITRLLQEGIGPLSGHPGHKPDSFENTQILSFYNDFFIDVVAETYTTGLTFFITEKTVRPIIGLTPFIIFGPQGYLSNLKARYGFKTFDRWWSEEYDNYQNYSRIKEMYKVIAMIDKLSDTELQSMYNDMTDTLDYNYNRLLEINGKQK